MQLTRYSDYALRLLMYLSLERGRLCSVTEVAAAYGISRNHLVKVAHHLAKAGFIDAVRGRQGGLRLAREPSKIRIGAIYRVTEPDLALAECFAEPEACSIAGACALRRALDEALRNFLRTLDGYTLEDLLARPAPLQSLLQIGPARGRGAGRRTSADGKRATQKAAARPRKRSASRHKTA